MKDLGIAGLAVLALSCSGFLLGCGGGGGGDGGDGGGGDVLLPFQFEWTGTVSAIRDGNGGAATLPDVNVGDTFVATMDYDPAAFGDGVAVTSDGLDFAAPAGLVTTFRFTSGGIYTQEVTGVRARSDGARDQWNWQSASGLLFQAHDVTDSSWSLPLPTSFAFMNTLLVNAVELLDPSIGNNLDLFEAEARPDQRSISFGNQLWRVIEN